MNIDGVKHLALYGVAILLLLTLTTLVLLLAGSGSADDMCGITSPGEKLPAKDRQTQAQVYYGGLPLVNLATNTILLDEFAVDEMTVQDGDIFPHVFRSLPPYSGD